MRKIDNIAHVTISHKVKNIKITGKISKKKKKKSFACPICSCNFHTRETLLQIYTKFKTTDMSCSKINIDTSKDPKVNIITSKEREKSQARYKYSFIFYLIPFFLSN